MPKLYIAEGGGESVYEIFDDEVSLGRGAANAVQVDDSHASKVHAVIRRLQGHWKLIDLESKNGTRVNGQYRNQSWLSDGDTLSIGAANVRYAAEGAAQGSPAAGRGQRPRAAAAPQMLEEEPIVPEPGPVQAPVVHAAPPETAAPVASAAPAAAAPAAPAAPVSRAPSRSGRRGAPAARKRRTTRDDYYDDDYDDEDEGPRYRRKNNSATIITIGIIGAVAFVIIMFAMFGSGESHNKAVFRKADAMADQRDYEKALRYAERNGDPDGADYGRLSTAMKKWRKTLQAQKDLEHSAKARDYFDRQIFRQQAITEGIFKAKDALPDNEVVKLLRDFLRDYRGTPTAHELLHADHSGYPMLREAMREYASPDLKPGNVLGKLQAQVDIDVAARRFGKAVFDLEYTRDMNRLCMTPENYGQLRKAVEIKVEDIVTQARRAFDDESRQAKKLIGEGRRGSARKKIDEMRDHYRGIPELMRRIKELENRM